MARARGREGRYLHALVTTVTSFCTAGAGTDLAQSLQQSPPGNVYTAVDDVTVAYKTHEQFDRACITVQC